MGTAMSHLGIPPSVDAYTAALEGLTNLNADILGKTDLPPIYDAGVKYQCKPHAVWRHADDVAKEGWGDCEDVSTWRAAELRVSGEDPYATAVVYPTGRHKYHAVVMRGDGQIEDPSIVLGMQVSRPDIYYKHIRDNFGDDAVGPILTGIVEGDAMQGGPCIVVGEDIAPENSKMTFDIFKTPSGGFTGVIRMPLNSGNAIYAKTSHSKTADSAAKKGVKLATKVAASVSHPKVKSKLTPETQRAVDALPTQEGKDALKKAALSKAAEYIPPDLKDAGGAAPGELKSALALDDKLNALDSKLGKAAYLVDPLHKIGGKAGKKLKSLAHKFGF